MEAEAYYKPQIPKEYRDDRLERPARDYENERFPSRVGGSRRLEEDIPERRGYRLDRTEREDRRPYPEESSTSTGRYRYDVEKSKSEGRNYRKELLERFADMDLEDHHGYHHGHSRYYE